MDRLAEKMARAAEVVPAQTKALETDVDALIARGDAFAARRQKSFAAQHAVLDTGMKGMDVLDGQLALLSNGDPSAASTSSAGSSEADPVHNTRGSEGQLIHKD